MLRSDLFPSTRRRGSIAAAVSALILGCLAPASATVPDLATWLPEMDAAASGWMGMRASLE